MKFGSRTNLLRDRTTAEEARVDFVELFFDLVFVFAVTQISHGMLDHLNPLGLLEAGVVLMAVWWSWVDTAWVTNWLDPKRPAVRVMLFALMLIGLLLASSIPLAFGERGLMFASAYVAMQVGRSVFMLYATRHSSPANFRNFGRITVWQSVCGVLWIAGGLQQGEWRIGLWALAVLIENIGPVFGFWIPVLGASTTADWNISGDHMAERCGLFVIIGLGETVLLAGSTFAHLDWTTPVVSAFVASFATIIAMWWIYFVHGAETARENIANSSDPGRVGRLVYTYVHILVVAGIIVTAVGVELVLMHPVGHRADFWVVLAILGGPGLFLIANLLIKWLAARHVAIWRILGVFVLAIAAAFSPTIEPIWLSAIAAATLVLVVAGELYLVAVR